MTRFYVRNLILRKSDDTRHPKNPFDESYNKHDVTSSKFGPKITYSILDDSYSSLGFGIG